MDHPADLRIRRLPRELANQIAAGEVVERPASVVKELVENSLDAGAREITIEAEQGGVRLLRVRDDGAGIHPEDLPLALARHATSKIGAPRDLAAIVSLGFRGEALAAIASVSRFSLQSRRHGNDSGWQLNGEDEDARPAPHPPGTTAEVRDLFFNLPARRKFLRSERTEYEHLEETVRRLALARSDVGFELIHNGRRAFALRPAHDQPGRERRLMSLVGRAFVDHALSVSFEAAGLRLDGWVGAPGYGRSQTDLQHVFLNGRVIRDRVVTHALRRGFEGVVEEGRFPAYVLYLSVDPAQVDVNVHPTKHEVRFRDARLVHDFLVGALREAMRQGVGMSAPVPLMPTRERSEAATVAEVPGHYQAKARPAPGRSPVQVLGFVQERFLLALHGDVSAGVFVADVLRYAREAAYRDFSCQWQQGSLAGRPLLFPITVRVTPAEAEQAEAPGWDRFGFDLSRVADDAVLVRTVPAALAADPEAGVRALLAFAENDDVRLLHLANTARWHGDPGELAHALASQPNLPGVHRFVGPDELARLLGGQL